METLSKALRTDVMADLDLKAMAQLLRSRGRGRDTVLAHITPREARRLKAEGGSGTINPDTGLPEFEELDFASFAEAPAQSFEPAPDVTPYAGGYGEFAQEVVPGGEGPSYAGEGLELLSAPGMTTVQTGAPSVSVPSGQLSARTPAELLGQLPATPTAETTGVEPPGYFDRLGTTLGKQLQDPATLARLGLGLGVGGLGAFQQMRGAAAAKQARTEQAKLGEPFRQQGMELMEQAKRGELSPASAQAYQAAQARMAQQQTRTGGVGVMQGAATLERLRSQLLQNQYSLGVNLANIGNQYIRGAITSGLQGDQALRTATNQFYGMLGNVLGGPTGQAVGAAARA
jgi:hypothetical protein